MAEEYISRKSVRDAIASLSIERFELTSAYRLYVEALDNVDKKVVKIQAASVEPVVHGKWIKPTRVPDSMMDECSLCGFDCGSYTYNYCPSCGARMDGDK